MMQKIIHILLALFLVCVLAGSAGAIPFQVSGSNVNSIDFDKDITLGEFTYTENEQEDARYLGEGDSYSYNFGTLQLPDIGYSKGSAEFEVFFNKPNPDGNVSDQSQFTVWTAGIFSGGELNFGDPEQFGYTHGSLVDGTFEIDFDDWESDFQWGTAVDLTGTITNVANPKPVPEPTTMLLFGAGLLGLAGLGRKKFLGKR